MARVVWRNEALDDLDQIIDYIERFDPDAADRMGKRLRQLGDSLDTFPHRGRPASEGTREMVTVPPYILRYRVEPGEQEEVVRILDIRHGRQLGGPP